MPELPEVEVLVRYLSRILPGRQIAGVHVGRERSLRPNKTGDFVDGLRDLEFVSIERRAKYLVFKLKGPRGDRTLLGHLGMTGRMYVQDKGEPTPKHTVVSLELDRGRFVFEDTRYFGRISFDLSALDRLGPEPLSEDFIAASFWRGLKRSRQAVKVRLLASDLVVGVGNIYASEALFRAGIDPRLACNRITQRQAIRLHGAIREVLGEAIELGSTLPLDWAGKDDQDGLFYFGRKKGQDNYEERLLVYGREGEACSCCSAVIQRVVQAARSTFFCPACQRRR